MDSPRRRHLAAFFGLTLALSAPFWVLGAVVDFQALPGLPVSALMAFTPALAAIILALRTEGRSGFAALLRRSIDGRRAPAALWVAVLLIPVFASVSVWVALRLAGQPVPMPEIPLWAPFVMMAAFFIGGLGEELGWTAYAVDPLQARWGPIRAALLLGAFWAAWHIIPFLEGGRSWSWIAWHAAAMPATRVIMLWAYRRGRNSVAAVVGYHAADNTAVFLFPVWGSFYDPKVAAVVIIAIAVALVVADRKGFSVRPEPTTT